MSTVSHAAFYFNDAFAGDVSPATGRFTDDESFARTRCPVSSGCPDELFIDPTDDDARAAQAEVDVAAAEWSAVAASDRVDADDTRELRQAWQDAKATFGVRRVRVQRVLEVGGETPVNFCVMLDGRGLDLVCGTGSTPAEATADAARQLDERYGIAREFSGYRVPVVAFVSGFPFRKPAEALAIARRIAVDPSYLDAALSVHLDGVTDLRPRPVPAVANVA